MKVKSLPRPLKITLIILAVLGSMVLLVLIVRTVMISQRQPRPTDYGIMSGHATILTTQFGFLDSIQQKRTGFDKTAAPNRTPKEDNDILNAYINRYEEKYAGDEIKNNIAVTKGTLKQPYADLKQASDEYLSFVRLFARDYEVTFAMKKACREIFERSEPFLSRLPDETARQFDSKMYRTDTSACREALAKLPDDAIYKQSAQRTAAVLDAVMPAVDAFSASDKGGEAAGKLLKAGQDALRAHPVLESDLAVANHADGLARKVNATIDAFKSAADAHP